MMMTDSAMDLMRWLGDNIPAHDQAGIELEGLIDRLRTQGYVVVRGRRGEDFHQLSIYDRVWLDGAKHQQTLGWVRFSEGIERLMVEWRPTVQIFDELPPLVLYNAVVVADEGVVVSSRDFCSRFLAMPPESQLIPPELCEVATVFGW